eukprot:11626281-Prorocentrum_lima.AAC.1
MPRWVLAKTGLLLRRPSNARKAYLAIPIKVARMSIEPLAHQPPAFAGERERERNIGCLAG